MILKSHSVKMQEILIYFSQLLEEIWIYAVMRHETPKVLQWLKKPSEHAEQLFRLIQQAIM